MRSRKGRSYRDFLYALFFLLAFCAVAFSAAGIFFGACVAFGQPGSAPYLAVSTFLAIVTVMLAALLALVITYEEKHRKSDPE